MDSVKVAIRIRPLINREVGTNILWTADTHQIKLKEGKGKPYIFDRVFDSDEITSDVYEEIVEDIVQSAMTGFNGTVFAYGQTSSGKTYTMMGDKANPGIIPLSIQETFNLIQKTPEREFLLRVSYMEIYNEVVRDLLTPSSDGPGLQIREDEFRNTVVQGLKEEMVRSPECVMKLMEAGEKRRHTGCTNMNERSSRSHTIFRMIIESRERVEPNHTRESLETDDAVKVSQLNLVDLAGSERASQTGAEGQRLKEGCHINKSLSTLGLVINQICKASESGGQSVQFISYRDSKLTRILQPSLGGNSRTAIICAVTPASMEDTDSTLRFASSAKKIKNKPHINEVLSDEALLFRQKREIKELKKKIQVMELEATKKQTAGLEVLLEEKNQLQKEQEERIQTLKKIILVSSQPADSMKKQRSVRRETWCPGALSAVSRSPPPWKSSNLDLNESTFIANQSSFFQKLDQTLLADDKPMSSLKRIRFLEDPVTTVKKMKPEEETSEEASEKFTSLEEELLKMRERQEELEYELSQAKDQKYRHMQEKDNLEMKLMSKQGQIEDTQETLDLVLAERNEIEKEKEISDLKIKHQNEKISDLLQKERRWENSHPDVTALRNENQDLRDQLKDTCSENRRLQEKSDERQDSVEYLHSMLDEVSKEANVKERTLSEQIGEYRQQVSVLQCQLEATFENNSHSPTELMDTNRLQDEITELKKEFQEVKEELEEQQEQNLKLKTELELKNAEKKEEEETSLGQVDTMKQNEEEIESLLEKLEDQMQENQQLRRHLEEARMGTQNESLSHDGKDPTEESTLHQDEIDDLKSKIHRFQEQIILKDAEIQEQRMLAVRTPVKDKEPGAELNETTRFGEKTMTDALATCDMLIEERDEAMNECKLVKEKMGKLQADMEHLKQNMAELKEQDEFLKLEKEMLFDQEKENMIEIVRLQAELSQREKKIEELQNGEDCSPSTKKIQRLDSNNENDTEATEQELQNLREEIFSLQRSSSDAQDMLQEANKNLSLVTDERDAHGKKIDNLEKELKCVKSDLESFDTMAELTKEKYERREKELAQQLQSAYDQIRDEVFTAADKDDSNKIAEYEDMVAQKEENIQDLAAKLESSSCKLEELEKQIKEDEQRKITKSQENQEKHPDESVNLELNAFMQENNLDLDELKKKLEEVEKIHSEKEDIFNQCQKKEERISELKSLLQEKEKDESEKENDSKEQDELKSSIAKLETVISEKDLRLEELQKESSTLKEKLNSEEDLQLQKDAVSSLEEQIKDKDAELMKIKEKLKELESQVDKKIDVAHKVQEEMMQQMSNNQEDSKEQNEMKSSIAKLENVISEKDLRLEELQKESSMLKEKSNGEEDLQLQRDAVSSLEEQIKAKDAELMKIKEKLKELESQVNQKDNSLEILEKKMDVAHEVQEMSNDEKDSKEQDELKSSIAKLETVISEKDLRLEDLQKESSMLKGNSKEDLQLQKDAVSSLEEQIKAKDAELMKIKEKLKELESQVDQKDNSLEILEKKMDVAHKVQEEMMQQMSNDEEDSTERKLREELAQTRKELSEIGERYGKLQTTSEHAQGALLAETNREMDQKRLLDNAERDRRESAVEFASERESANKQINELLQKVNELQTALCKSNVDKDITMRQNKKATEECDFLRQQVKDLENIHHNQPSVIPRNAIQDPEKMAVKIKQLCLNVELTKQTSDKLNVTNKKLQDENRRLESEVVRAINLQGEVTRLQAILDQESRMREEQDSRRKIREKETGEMRNKIVELQNEMRKMESKLDVQNIESSETHNASVKEKEHLQDALNEAKQAISRLETKIQELKKKEEDISLNHQEDQEQIENLKIQMEEEKQVKKDTLHELESLQDRFSHVSKHLEVEKARFSELDTRNISLISEFESIQDDLQSNKKCLEEESHKRSLMEQKLEQVMNELDVKRQSGGMISETLKSKDAEISELLLAKEQLELKNAELGGNNERSTEELEKVKSAISLLESEKNDLKSRIQELEEIEKASLNSKESETDNSELLLAKEELELKNMELKEKLEFASEELESIKSAFSLLESEKNELECKMKSLDEDVEDSDAQLANYKKIQEEFNTSVRERDVLQHQQKKETMISEKEESRITENDRIIRITELEKMKEESNLIQEELQMNIKELQQEKSSILEKLIQLEAEMDELKQELKESKKAENGKEELQNKITDLESELEALIIAKEEASRKHEEVLQDLNNITENLNEKEENICQLLQSSSQFEENDPSSGRILVLEEEVDRLKNEIKEKEEESRKSFPNQMLDSNVTDQDDVVNHLRINLEEYSTKNGMLQDEINKLQEDKHNLELQFKDMDSQLVTLRMSMHNSDEDEEVARLRDEIMEKEEKISDLDSLLQEKGSNIEDLSSARESLERDFEILTQENLDLKSTLEEQKLIQDPNEENLSHVIEELSNTVKDKDLKIEQLLLKNSEEDVPPTNASSLENEIRKLKDELSAKEAEIEDVIGKVEEFKSRCKQLEDDLSKQHSASTLENEDDGLGFAASLDQEMIESLSDQVADLKMKLEDKDEQIDDLMRKIDSLEARKNLPVEASATSHEEMENLQLQISQLSSETDAKDDEILNLSRMKREAEEKLDHLQSLRSSEEEAVSEMKKQLLDLQKSLEREDSRVSNMRKAKEEAEDVINELKLEKEVLMKSSDADADRLKTDLQEKEEKLRILQEARNSQDIILQELISEKKFLEEKCDCIQNTLKCTEDAMQGIQTNLEELTSENEKLQVEMTKIREAKENLEFCKTDLDSQLEELRLDIKAREDAEDSRIKEIVELQAELEEHKENTYSLDRELKSVYSMIREKASEMEESASSREELERNFKIMKEENLHLKSSIEKLEMHGIENMNDEVEQYKEKIKKLEAEVARITGSTKVEMEELKKKNVELDAEMKKIEDSLQTKDEDYTHRIESMKDELEQYKEEVNTLEEEVARITDLNESTEAKMEELKKKNLDLDAEMKKLEDSLQIKDEDHTHGIESVKDELEQYKEEVNKLEEEVARITDLNESTEVKMEELRKKNLDLEAEMKKLEDSLQIKDEDHKLLEKELNESKTKHDTAVKERELLDNEMDRLKREIEKLSQIRSHQLKDEENQKLSGIQTQMIKLETDAEELKGLLYKKELEVQSKEMDLNNWAERYQTLESNLEKAVISAKEEISSQNQENLSKIAELEEKLMKSTQYEEEFEKISKMHSEAEEKFKEEKLKAQDLMLKLEEEKQTMSIYKSETSNELEQEKEKSRDLTEKLKNLESEFNEKLKTTEEELSEMKMQPTHMSETANELFSEKGKNKELSEKLSKLEKEFSKKMKSTEEKFDVVKKDLFSRIRNLEDNCIEADEEIEEEKKKYTELEQKYRITENQLKQLSELDISKSTSRSPLDISARAGATSTRASSNNKVGEVQNLKESCKEAELKYKDEKQKVQTLVKQLKTEKQRCAQLVARLEDAAVRRQPIHQPTHMSETANELFFEKGKNKELSEKLSKLEKEFSKKIKSTEEKFDVIKKDLFARIRNLEDNCIEADEEIEEEKKKYTELEQKYRITENQLKLLRELDISKSGGKPSDVEETLKRQLFGREEVISDLQLKLISSTEPLEKKVKELKAELDVSQGKVFRLKQQIRLNQENAPEDTVCKSKPGSSGSTNTYQGGSGGLVVSDTKVYVLEMEICNMQKRIKNLEKELSKYKDIETKRRSENMELLEENKKIRAIIKKTQAKRKVTTTTENLLTENPAILNEGSKGTSSSFMTREPIPASHDDPDDQCKNQ